MQIEYALAAVASGAASVGIKATNGVVLATEKKHKSILYEEHSTFKVEQITDTIGMVYSGMGPDYRVLVRRARKIAQSYQLEKGEDIPTAQLVSRVAMVMQEFTQSGGVRPFGVSLLIAGWDKEESKPFLFQCDPSGAYFAWKATAMGKNFVNAKTFLEKRFDDKLEVMIYNRLYSSQTTFKLYSIETYSYNHDNLLIFSLRMLFILQFLH